MMPSVFSSFRTNARQQGEQPQGDTPDSHHIQSSPPLPAIPPKYPRLIFFPSLSLETSPSGKRRLKQQSEISTQMNTQFEHVCVCVWACKPVFCMRKCFFFSPHLSRASLCWDINLAMWFITASTHQHVSSEEHHGCLKVPANMQRSHYMRFYTH